MVEGGPPVPVGGKTVDAAESLCAGAAARIPVPPAPWGCIAAIKPAQPTRTIALASAASRRLTRLCRRFLLHRTWRVRRHAKQRSRLTFEYPHRQHQGRPMSLLSASCRLWLHGLAAYCAPTEPGGPLRPEASWR